MDSPAQKILGAVVLGACLLGGVLHWRGRSPAQPLAETATAEDANTSEVTPPASDSAPAQTVASASEPSPGQVADALAEIRALHENKAYEEALAGATRLVTQLAPYARTRSDELGQAYLWCGELHENLKQFDRVLEDFEHVYFLWRDDTPDSGRAWLYAYDGLTRAYARAGRWTEVLAMGERGLKAAESTPAGNPVYTFNLYQRRIDALLNLGRKVEAASACDAFFAWARPLPPGNELKAKALNSLAACYRRAESPEKRLEALAEIDALLAPDARLDAPTPEGFARATAAAYAALEAGRRIEAIRTADALRERLTDLADPGSAATATLALARLHRDVDRAEDALALAQRALELQESMECSRPIRREHLRLIGGLLDRLGHWEKQAALAAQVLELSRQEFGENSAEFVSDLKSYGHALFRSDRDQEAVTALRDAVARAERLEKPDPDLLVSVLSDLGFVIIQSGVGAPEEAEAVLRRSVDLNERTCGKLHESSIDLHTNLAAALIDQKRYGDAARVLDQAFACIEANHASDSHAAGWAYFQRAALLSRQQRWAEAFAAAQRAAEIRERAYGPDHFRTRVMMRLYVKTAWAAGERLTAIGRGERLLQGERADHGWTVFRDLVLCAKLAGWQAEIGNDARARELIAMLRSAGDEYYEGRTK